MLGYNQFIPQSSQNLYTVRNSDHCNIVGLQVGMVREVIISCNQTWLQNKGVCPVIIYLVVKLIDKRIKPMKAFTSLSKAQKYLSTCMDEGNDCDIIEVELET